VILVLNGTDKCLFWVKSCKVGALERLHQLIREVQEVGSRMTYRMKTPWAAAPAVTYSVLQLLTLLNLKALIGDHKPMFKP
jgi:hypothetical protein